MDPDLRDLISWHWERRQDQSCGHGYNKSPCAEPIGWERVSQEEAHLRMLEFLPQGLSTSGVPLQQGKMWTLTSGFCNTPWTSSPRNCSEADQMLWNHILAYCWFPLCKCAPASVSPALRVPIQRSQDYWQLSWLLWPLGSSCACACVCFKKPECCTNLCLERRDQCLENILVKSLDMVFIT